MSTEHDKLVSGSDPICRQCASGEPGIPEDCTCSERRTPSCIAAAPPSAPQTRAAIIEECANVIRDELWRLPPDHDLTPTGWTRKRTFEMLLKDIRALASIKQEQP